MKRADRFRVTVVPPREGEGDAWYWRIRPPHGKKGETRRSSETTDRAEAEDGARRTADRLNAGVIRPGSDPTALEVFDRFYAAKEMTKTPPGTLKTFRLAHRWLASKLTLPASRLTSGAILAVRDVMETKIAASTCNLYVGCLRRCWGWARARDTMFPGLVAFPKVKDLDEVPTEKRPFYPEEVAAVLQELADFSGGKWLGLFRCLSDSGKRVGSLLDATGGDVHAHPERPWIDVVDGKSSERQRAYVLPETVALLPRRTPDDLLFQGRAGKVVVSTVNGVLHRALELAGLDHLKGFVDVHSFRRFVVDQNCQDGESIARGMRITGHQDPSIFLAYQRNSRDMPHDALRRTRDRVEASTPSTTPGDAAWSASMAASAGPRSTRAGGHGAPTALGLEAADAASPPRVPPRIKAVPAGSCTPMLGRSRAARLVARALTLDPMTPAEVREMTYALAGSTGLQRGAKEHGLEAGELTRAQAVNTKRSAKRREARRAR